MTVAIFANKLLNNFAGQFLGLVLRRFQFMFVIGCSEFSSDLALNFVLLSLLTFLVASSLLLVATTFLFVSYFGAPLLLQSRRLFSLLSLDQLSFQPDCFLNFLALDLTGSFFIPQSGRFPLLQLALNNLSM